MKMRKTLLLLFPAAFFAACRLAGADIASETRLGDAAFAAGDFVNAAQFYDSALTLAKNDENRWPELALKLGEARLRAGDLAGARTLLNEYRTRFPARSAGVLPAEILLADGHIPDAEKFLEVVIANSTEPELACNAEFLLAYARILQKNYADAVSGFEQLERKSAAADLARWAARAHLASIYTLLLAEEYAEADAKLAAGKYRSTETLSYRELELLSKMRQNGDFAAFEKEWAQLLRETKEHPGLLLSDLALAGAAAAEKANNPQRAGELLNSAFQLSIDDAHRKEALLRLINLQSQSDPALAASTINRYLEFYPATSERVALLMQAGRLLADAGAFAAAEETYRRLVEDNRLTAAERFEAAREAATAAESAGNREGAEEMLRFLTGETDSESHRDEGHFLLGEYLLRQKEYRRAAEEFRQIPPATKRGDDARYRLLQALMELEDYSEAIPVAEALRESGNKEYALSADYLRAVLREKAGQPAQARSAYLQFITAHPGSSYHAVAHYRAAAIAFARQEFNAAAEEFLAYARQFADTPQAPAALYQAIQAADLAGNAALSAEALNTLDREFPGSDAAIDARLQLADSRIAKEQWDLAEKLLDDAAALGAARNPDVAAEVLYDRAKIAVAQEDVEEADRYLSEILNTYISSTIAADAALLRGNLAANRGDFPRALKDYLRASELRPGGIFGEVAAGRIADCRYALYAETMESADLNAAMELYRKLAENATSEQLKLQSLYKLGKCEELAGAPEAALAAYNRALYLARDLRQQREIPPDPAWSAKAAYNAVQLYLKSGDAAGAENALRVLNILEELQLPVLDEINHIRQEIQRKFNLQEKK